MVNTQTADMLLVNANDLAKMLSISVRHLWRMKSAKKLPKAIQIGNCVRWKLLSISEWLCLGCPNQQEFEARQKVRKS